MHRRDVDISLYEVAPVLFRYGVLGLVYAVQLVALVVDERLGRVDVLRRLLVVLQDAASEGHDAPRNGMHGEDDAPGVAVLQRAVIAAVAKPRGDEKLLLEALRPCGLGQRVALRHGVTELEAADGVVAEAARAEIRKADGAPALGVHEVVLEVMQGPVVHDEQALALALLALLLVGQFPFVDFYVVFLGQPAQGFGVGHLLMLHDEAHGVAALAAREAVAVALRGRHHERRRLLVVERAQPLVVHPGLSQGDELRHDVNDVRRVHDFVNSGFVYHSVVSMRLTLSARLLSGQPSLFHRQASGNVLDRLAPPMPCKDSTFNQQSTAKLKEKHNMDEYLTLSGNVTYDYLHCVKMKPKQHGHASSWQNKNARLNPRNRFCRP